MARVDELRLMTRVAQIYYEQGLRQSEIVEKLGISQSSISRLLKRAREEQIVRISVNVPAGVHSELEGRLRESYGLEDAVVVESGATDDDQLLMDIGRAAAFYLETILQAHEVVGVSSWSRALLAMMDSMNRMPRSSRDALVVQILGGMGDPNRDIQFSQVMQQFSGLVEGEAIHLPAPAVVREAAGRSFFLSSPPVQRAYSLFRKITTLVVGVGAVTSRYNACSSRIVFKARELREVRGQGAVGDVCLHFFDARGKSLNTSLEKSVIGIGPAQIRGVKRRIGVAGGSQKVAALRGAMRGGWINRLITDRKTARRLLDQGPE